MTDYAATLEATALASALRRSRWLYPLVNSGHILGIALLIGAVVPMDLRLAGLRKRGSLEDTIAMLRPVAAAGLLLATVCGALLFIVQASDYVASPWFQAKMAVILCALANVALHLRLLQLPPSRQRPAAWISLGLWPLALILGRMIAYA